MTINVLDAQDMPPSFIGSPYFGYVYEVSVPVSLPLILYPSMNVVEGDHFFYTINYISSLPGV